jgi:hypothetical protein
VPTRRGYQHYHLRGWGKAPFPAEAILENIVSSY